MVFHWLARRRRRNITRQPFPQDWERLLQRRIPYSNLLDNAAYGRLRRFVQIFLAEKHFEGCRGFIVTDEVRVTVAGHAGCLVSGRDHDFYPLLKTILVYPSAFLVEEKIMEPDGVVAEFGDELAGQSWDVGVIVLAWDEVLRSSEKTGDGFNVVLHEFAHQLDTEETGADGLPWMDDPKLRARWSEVMQAEYDRLHADLRRGRVTLLDPYAAEDPAEFFAVATETFFELPLPLRQRHPELYRLLAAYYGQDPASRLDQR